MCLLNLYGAIVVCLLLWNTFLCLFYGRPDTLRLGGEHGNPGEVTGNEQAARIAAQLGFRMLFGGCRAPHGYERNDRSTEGRSQPGAGIDRADSPCSATNCA